MSTTIPSPIALARREQSGQAPLRSYLFMLAPHPRMRGDRRLIHCVLEESPERAIQVCGQSHPGHRIFAMRDITDQATAA